MSFPCSCSCMQLDFAARHPGLQPATQGKINHTPHFPQTAGTGQRRVTQEMARMRQTPPFLRRNNVPYSPLAHRQLNDTPPLNQFPFSLSHILAHLGFKGRDMQLCWWDSQDLLSLQLLLFSKKLSPAVKRESHPDTDTRISKEVVTFMKLNKWVHHPQMWQMPDVLPLAFALSFSKVEKTHNFHD